MNFKLFQSFTSSKHTTNWIENVSCFVIHKLIQCLIYIIYRKMFKQSKKTPIIQPPQQSISFSKTLRSAQNVPKDMLQFLARQISVLKDISQSINNTHADIVANRLNECIHLIQKKLVYSLGDNPQQYHDYIQDFYEGQMNTLRAELNYTKMQMGTKKRELEEFKNSYEILIKEKQHYMQSLQTSRVSKSSGGNNLEQYEQNCQLKKQLDHCRMLLQQNSSFIEEQAKAIEQLSSQLKNKQKQHKHLRQKYEQKISFFDGYVNKYTQQTEATIKNLSNDQKSYQIQLKQLSLTKIRVLQERANLQKQLQMKVEQIQLLTRKILQDQIVLSKQERTIIMKDKLIDQLYQEIDSVNGSLSRIGKKEEDFQKLSSEKTEEIMKLEDRLRIVNQTNQRLEKKINQCNKKIDDLQRQNQKMQKKADQYKHNLNQTENQIQIAHKKLQITQKSLAKITKQKQRCEKQIKIMEERYQQLYQRSKQQKQVVKKQIMSEINQLIGLVQQKQTQVKLLVSQKDNLNKQLKRQREGRSQVQENFEKMNGLMGQIQRKIDSLQSQNGELNDTKCMLEGQLIQMSNQVQKLVKLQQQYECVLAEKKNLAEQLELLRKNQQDALSCKKTYDQQIQKKQTELSQTFSQQRKQYKQIINKKDFQIKQLESKVKILQQELRDSSNLFDNEKFKMSLKIKQLEELLKQRYDFSSRFSQHSEGGF